MLTDNTLLYRASLVLDHILTDDRIMKISTAIKLVRATFKWPESEDAQLHEYVKGILLAGRHPVHVKAMKRRRLGREQARANKRKAGT